MRPIGFSTGALARGDFRRALSLLGDRPPDAIELSALRDHELASLMSALKAENVGAGFAYRSVHVPSKFKALSEREVSSLLRPCIDLGIPIILHPDAITETSRWRDFGSLLCIENMDKRKRTGRTLAELEPFFATFSNARFCLDIGHAHQIDSTMSEARLMLRRFVDRLLQIHISEIDAQGHHNPLSLATTIATQNIVGLIPEDVPIIIESIIPPERIDREIEAARSALRLRPKTGAKTEYFDWGELA
jgi:hypothetical protein